MSRVKKTLEGVICSGRMLVLLSKQELAPFFGEQNRLSRRLRACPSVFLDKQSIKERGECKFLFNLLQI